jgi:hypothetical protein
MQRLEEAVGNGDGRVQMRASYYIPDSLEELQADPADLIDRAGATLRSTS